MHSINFADSELARTNKILRISAQLWFTIAVIGQLFFAVYVAVFYGGSAMSGNLSKWNEVLEHGYVPGDTVYNAATIAHLSIAVIMMIGGPLQFIPWVRNKAPDFHRWNGRIYVLIAIIASLSGLLMMWKPGQGPIGGMIAGISISINSVLIFLFALLAWRTAVSRQFISHQHWAFRLFLVVNGVWFFRIGLMFWLFVNGGPVGFDATTFRGPFLVFLGFAQYVLPLGIYELYLRTHRQEHKNSQLVMAGGILLCTIITAIGIFAATVGMWLPELQ